MTQPQTADTVPAWEHCRHIDAGPCRKGHDKHKLDGDFYVGQVWEPAVEHGRVSYVGRAASDAGLVQDRAYAEATRTLPTEEATTVHRLSDDEAFFYSHGPWAHPHPDRIGSLGDRDSPTLSRVFAARDLTDAESAGRNAGLSFDWQTDPDIDSSDFSDETPAWPLYVCYAYDADGDVVGSLGGIDFGQDGSPHSDPYARVVQAELAAEYLREQEAGS